MGCKADFQWTGCAGRHRLYDKDGRVRAGTASLLARLAKCPKRLALDAEVERSLAARSTKVWAMFFAFRCFAAMGLYPPLPPAQLTLPYLWTIPTSKTSSKEHTCSVCTSMCNHFVHALTWIYPAFRVLLSTIVVYCPSSYSI